MFAEQRRALLVPGLLLFAGFAAAQAWLPTGGMRPVHASGEPDAIHHALGLLQYVRTDYVHAVGEDGKILDADEYAEQQEFLGQARALLEAETRRSHDPGSSAALLQRLRDLEGQVTARSAPAAVRIAVNALQDDLVRAYRLQLWPSQCPDLGLGARVWTQACAACHGADGGGGTAIGARLVPPPPNLLAVERDHTLSPYQVFNRVTFGVPGAAMPAFETLTPAERWDVAFYVLAMRCAREPRSEPCTASRPLRPEGERPTLQDLARLTNFELEQLLTAAGIPRECSADQVARWRADPSRASRR
jgi:mono/diheme cytochrome c family protein